MNKTVKVSAPMDILFWRGETINEVNKLQAKISKSDESWRK